MVDSTPKSGQPSANNAAKNTVSNTSPPQKSANTNPNPAAAASSVRTAGSGGPSAKRSPPPETNNVAKKPTSTFCPGTVAMRLFTRPGKFPGPQAPTDQQKEQPGPVLDPNTKTALAHCFHLALALLERSTGHDAFIKVALRIVNRRREMAEKDKTPEVGLFAKIDPKERPKEISKEVKKFLAKIRSNGVPLCITPGIKGIYGFTQRWSWGDNMDKYEPEKAAVMYLHKGMVEGLLKAADAVEQCMRQRRDINEQIQKTPSKAQDAAIKKKLEELPKSQAYAQRSFERAIFCASVTLAHEFVHCFTGYLSGRVGIATPPKAEPPYGPYGTDKRGESGWDWCELAFGGLAHFWYPKGSPNELTSGYYIGIPALMELIESKTVDWKENSRMYVIDHEMVKKIIEMKDWETAFSADRNWMHKVRKQGDPGILYKEWWAKHREVVRIWDSYYGNTEEDLKAAKAIAMGGLGDMAFASSLKVVEQIAKPLTAKDLVAIKA